MIACDLGSNTFRVVEIDCDTLERKKEFQRVVRTADGIQNNGIINDDAVKRVIMAINDAKEIFDLTDAKAVTTAAMRQAKNSDQVLKTIKYETGLEFEVISALQEADFTRIAVQSQLKVEDYVLMDLGGGSTELIFDNDSKSFDIGIVTLVEKYGLKDLRDGIKKDFQDIREFAKSKKPKYFIATSGTPTTIASLILGLDYEHYDYKRVNGMKLTLQDFDVVLGQLIDMSEAERVRWVGVGREDLIVAGVLMFKEIVEIFEFNEVIIIDDGLREGVAISLC